ncbi:hypothetical protein O3G_MSEX013114 [Manduca sexta]|uniref:Uncharacterized protein n=1 Tax=Manduca sexta TaxID=7130 RepID=A0A922CY10_MANSE|nr:hypothetical protein O3G_MSEX013114 [Manduca sexta]
MLSKRFPSGRRECRGFAVRRHRVSQADCRAGLANRTRRALGALRRRRHPRYHYTPILRSQSCYGKMPLLRCTLKKYMQEKAVRVTSFLSKCLLCALRCISRLR